MGNTVFSDAFMQELDNFGEGLSQHAYPIKYEVLTPDLSIFCFWTIGQDGAVNYFALLHSDNINSRKETDKIIQSAFGKVIEYIKPVQDWEVPTESELKSFMICDNHKCDLAVLARTERPDYPSYWANYISIQPNDNINKKLAHLNDKDKKHAMTAIIKVMQTQVATVTEDKTDFLSTWQQKVDRLNLMPEDVTINDTRLAMNVYKNVNGNWEVFYNYVKAPTK